MRIILITAAALASTAAFAQPRDSRGIPVVSDPATPPAGANAPVPADATQVNINPNQQAVFQTQPATGPYPACTRGQTDRCTQTYERGMGAAPHRRSGRRH